MKSDAVLLFGFVVFVCALFYRELWQSRAKILASSQRALRVACAHSITAARHIRTAIEESRPVPARTDDRP